MQQSSEKAGTAGRLVSFLVILLFFLSGACGLVYEVSWTRMFSVVAGGTTRALTAVLAAYMGGLALGGFLGGRWVDRRAHRPVLVYGLLEGIVGAAAVIVSFAIPWLLPVLKVGKSAFGEYSVVFDVFRFLVSASALLLPATLMGATFPVLLRGILSNRERFGFTAGYLYGANTLGAVAGSFSAGFFLIPAFGLSETTWLAAGANVFILLIVLAAPWLKRVRAEARVLEEPAAVAGPVGESAPRSYLFGVICAGYALSGLCAMVYQVGWVRVLALSLGNSTYAISLIFAAYIGGLALGGIVMTPFADRLKKPMAWAAALEVVIGLSAIAVMPMFELVTARMFNWVLEFKDHFGSFQAVRFLTAFGLIVVPTMAMGALFPVMVRMAGDLRKGVGEPAGQVYAFNTAGAIVGAFLAGHVLIRWLQVENTLFVATGLSVLIGIGWLLTSRVSLLPKITAAAAAAAVAAGAIAVVPRWDPILINSGPFMYADVFEEDLKAGEDIRDLLHNYFQVLFHEEGVETTVSVLELRASGERYLRINGKTDASSKIDMPTQLLSAHIPALLHPDPKKVMILGLASGVSAGSILLYPVERVDCLEISPAVVRSSRFFKRVNNLDYQDPRFHLIVDDARNYLALSDVRYDLIILEPSNPWVAGMSTLFTREMYELLHDHLEPGGMAMVFIPAYNLDPATMRMLLRTLTGVFEYVSLWETIPGGDYAALVSNRPIKVDPDLMRKRASKRAVAADLARTSVQSGDEIFARFVMGGLRIREIEGEGPVHTDDRRQLEFIVPRLLANAKTNRLNAILNEILSNHEPADALLTRVSKDESALLSRFDVARTLFYRAMSLNRGGEVEYTEFEFIIQAWRNALHFSRNAYPAEFASRELASVLVERARVRNESGDEAGAVEDWKEAHGLDSADAFAADRLVRYYFEKQDLDQARAWGKKALQRLHNDAYVLDVLGNIAISDQRLEEAENYFRMGMSSTPRNPEFQWKLGLVLAMRGRLPEAEAQLKKMVRDYPDLAEPKILLADVLIGQGRKDEAMKYVDQARAMAPDHPLLKRLEQKIK